MYQHRQVRVTAPKAEVDAAIVAINLYLEGHNDAKALTAEDPSIDSADLLVDVANSYDNMKDLLVKFKQRLEGGK